jgi:ADP-ribose pyrophosphatase YjhB (NUDIX family)
MSVELMERPRQMTDDMAHEADNAKPPQQRITRRMAGSAALREVAPRLAATGLKLMLRRAFYQTWRVLPRWCQRLAVRLAAPKVTLGACAVILDGRGRVLLAHHTYRARPWGLPGGFVSTGEQPAAGLERELREELGVSAQVGPVLSAETCPASHQLTIYYRATLLGTPREDGIEIDGFRYAAPEEVSTLLGDDADTCLRCMQG